MFTAAAIVLHLSQGYGSWLQMRLRKAAAARQKINAKLKAVLSETGASQREGTQGRDDKGAAVVAGEVRPGANSDTLEVNESELSTQTDAAEPSEGDVRSGEDCMFTKMLAGTWHWFIGIVFSVNSRVLMSKPYADMYSNVLVWWAYFFLLVVLYFGIMALWRFSSRKSEAEGCTGVKGNSRWQRLRERTGNLWIMVRNINFQVCCT